MNEEVKINFGPMFGNLTVAFIVLKLCKVIDWSWWWVFSPFWGSIVLAIILLLCTAYKNK